jgi:UDP-N-acetyl-D-mannosaminuronic acid dehydrogenase
MKKSVAVIGIGRVGLPMALVLAEEGFLVYGVGRDEKKIQKIQKGAMPFIEVGAPKLLKKHVNKRFFPTTDYGVIEKVNTIILTLGTPIDENMNPVLNQIDAVLEKILPLLRRGQLIILRSTVSPRTTEYVAETINKRSPYRVGQDISLAFCPERIAEGKAVDEIKSLPQIVGGVDKKSTKKAIDFFESFGITCLPTDAISAELAKLFTNMYRYISFGIANEFFIISESFNRNIHEIVSLVNTGYKRGGLALPGLTGGPCLFKDGFFLINENPYLDLITASWKVNESIPLVLVRKIRERINLNGKKVTILGLSFKPEIDDIRESLSFKLRKALLREHAKVTLHDPFVTEYQYQEIESDLMKAIKDCDVIFIATRHSLYEKEKKNILKNVRKNTYICDIWNTFGMNKLIYTIKSLEEKT